MVKLFILQLVRIGLCSNFIITASTLTDIRVWLAIPLVTQLMLLFLQHLRRLRLRGQHKCGRIAAGERVRQKYRLGRGGGWKLRGLRFEFSFVLLLQLVGKVVQPSLFHGRRVGEIREPRMRLCGCGRGWWRRICGCRACGGLGKSLDLKTAGSLDEWRQILLQNVYLAMIHILQ